MKTCLTFRSKDLINDLNSLNEFYEITDYVKYLHVNKKYNNKKGRPFSIKLPKEIRILPETVGLIVGEGFLGQRTFVFANSNEKAIDKILEFLTQFNLPLGKYLEISMKGKNDNYKNMCQKFWEKHLGIKIKKVRLRREFRSITKHGTLHIILNNSLVAKILIHIINISKKKVERNRSLAVEYLKGIIAAEGNINVKKSTNCVYMVRISASKSEERTHYKKCLNKVGINLYCKDMPTISKEEGEKRGWKTTHGRAGAVIISRWDNFVKLFLLDLLELHPDKQKKFLKYFLNNKFTKQFISFYNFVGKEFTMKDAQTFFGFAGRKVDRVKTLYAKGFLSRKINKKQHTYELKDNYFTLYNKIQEETDSKSILKSKPEIPMLQHAG